MIEKVILVTSASNVVGRLAANALSQSRHTVYAALSDAAHEERLGTEIGEYASGNGVDLRTLSMNTREERSIAAAIERIIAECGRLDVVVHVNEDLAFGPAEAFAPEQFADIYDRVVLAAQRVNRFALPHMRRQRVGLLVWVSSSSSAGGALPYLAPDLVAMAALDALAVQYSRELGPWGIETTIIVPGIQRHALQGLTDAERPDDAWRAAEYEEGPLMGVASQVLKAIGLLVPADADVGPIAGAIVEAVDTPFGERPFRIHVDPAEDGGSVGFAVVDRIRREMLDRVGLAGLTKPAGAPSSRHSPARSRF